MKKVQPTRVLKISFFAILSAFIVEFIFGIVSNSLALLTDSIHALLDSLVTVVLLIAAKMSLKPPDAEHTYGHGKIESLGGMFGGIAIFLIALFFIYESILGFQSSTPHILTGTLAIIGALYTIGIDIFRILFLRKNIKKIGGTLLKADFYHAFLDLGSTLIAIIGIGLASYGFYNGDFISALILGIILIFLSIKLIYRTSLDLTDIITPETVRKVKEIASSTEGVLGAEQVLMRKSGNTLFSDITIQISGDVSFEKAHEISDQLEKKLKESYSNIQPTIHFEPSWREVPIDSQVFKLAGAIPGVKEIHNISSYSSEGKLFVSFHVMVDKTMNLDEAHKISEDIEKDIQKNIPSINHITIHLEPYFSLPKILKFEGKVTEEKIKEILSSYSEVKKIGRVVIFNYKDIFKIDIDCSFERALSIEKIHDVISEIERNIKNQMKNVIVTIHPEPI